MLDQPSREDSAISRDRGRHVLAICTGAALGASTLGAVADLYRSGSHALGVDAQIQLALTAVLYVLAVTAGLGAVVVGVPWTLLDWARAGGERDTFRRLLGDWPGDVE